MSIAQRLSTQQLQQVFGVAHMTVYNWRKGSANRTPLPFEVDDPKAIKPRIHFLVRVIKAWAKENDVPYDAKVLKQMLTGEGWRKPGRRPRVKH